MRLVAADSLRLCQGPVSIVGIVKRDGVFSLQRPLGLVQDLHEGFAPVDLFDHLGRREIMVAVVAIGDE